MRNLILAGVAMLVVGCGGYEDEKKTDEKPSEAWLSLKGDVDKYCGNCHNGSQQQAFTEARWKSSTAKARVSNGSMPPGGGLPEAVKAKMIAF